MIDLTRARILKEVWDKERRNYLRMFVRPKGQRYFTLEMLDDSDPDSHIIATESKIIVQLGGNPLFDSREAILEFPATEEGLAIAKMLFQS